MNMFKFSIAVARVLPCIAVAAWAAPASANDQGAKALEGVWNVLITLRNCQTGAEIRSFPGLTTFAKGGTLSSFAAGGLDVAPVSRSPGHGAWEYLGDSAFTYSQKFLLLTPFGGPNGSISELRLVTMDANGNTFHADGVAVITFPNGSQSPQLCATEQGTRLF